MIGVKKTGVAGHRFETPDGGIGIELLTHEAVHKGDVYLKNMNNSTTNPFITKAVATAAYPEKVVVALEAIDSGAVGCFQLYGVCDAFCEGTVAITAGDYLQVTNGLSYFTTETTTKSVYSSAMALEAYAVAAAALKKVILLDVPTQTA